MKNDLATPYIQGSLRAQEEACQSIRDEIEAHAAKHAADPRLLATSAREKENVKAIYETEHASLLAKLKRCEGEHEMLLSERYLRGFEIAEQRAIAAERRAIVSERWNRSLAIIAIFVAVGSAYVSWKTYRWQESHSGSAR